MHSTVTMSLFAYASDCLSEEYGHSERTAAASDMHDNSYMTKKAGAFSVMQSSIFFMKIICPSLGKLRCMGWMGGLLVFL